MKRFILLLLAVVLLSGCHNDAGETTQQSTGATEVPIQHIYDPDNSITELTQGAVNAYDLSGHSVTGIRFFGEQLLVFTMDDHVELTTVLTLGGEQWGVLRSTALECALYPPEVTVSADGQTLAYYNAQENSVILLDKTLSELRRIQLPDQVTDRPVLTKDLTSLYYCAGNEIYSLDLESGLSQLLKQHNCLSQSLTALHFDDTVLEVFLTLESGEGQVAFISTENGQTTGTDKGLLSLSSYGDHYLLQRLDGSVTETLLGQRNQEMRSVALQPAQALYPAFPLNAIATVSGSQVTLCDVTSGKTTSLVDLGQNVQVMAAIPHPSENQLFMWVQDQQTASPLLLQWKTAETKVSDDTVHLLKRFTASDPDADGIAASQELADSLGADRGITLTVSPMAAPQGYEFVAEHQVASLNDALTQLDTALQLLPADFLKGLAAVNKSGTVRIGIVRQILDITGKPNSDLGGLHYVTSGDHYIVLTVGDTMGDALLHQLSHVLDSYVFSHSVTYDTWDTLNPKKFTYLSSYDVPENAEDPMLSGDTQAFINAYGMTYAKEDRATLFTAAVTPGNEALFAADILQNKLQTMCKAIRKSYGWEKAEDLTLPWEQYLKTE